MEELFYGVIEKTGFDRNAFDVELIHTKLNKPITKNYLIEHTSMTVVINVTQKNTNKGEYYYLEFEPMDSNALKRFKSDLINKHFE